MRNSQSTRYTTHRLGRPFVVGISLLNLLKGSVPIRGRTFFWSAFQDGCLQGKDWEEDVLALLHGERVLKNQQKEGHRKLRVLPLVVVFFLVVIVIVVIRD